MKLVHLVYLNNDRVPSCIPWMPETLAIFATTFPLRVTQLKSRNRNRSPLLISGLTFDFLKYVTVKN